MGCWLWHLTAFLLLVATLTLMVLTYLDTKAIQETLGKESQAHAQREENIKLHSERQTVS